MFLTLLESGIGGARMFEGDIMSGDDFLKWIETVYNRRVKNG